MTQFRIHPTIGLARVGNSDEFYLAPETPAALPIGGSDVDGGLPIKRGTEAEHITSADLRDSEGKLKRQAARFRIFAYETGGAEAYPNGGGTEVTIGSQVHHDGEVRTVASIRWQVHVANKKANTYVLEYPDSGEKSVIGNYESGLPPLRNPTEGDPKSPERIRKLTIDPGPRVIEGATAGPVGFDQATEARALGTGALPDYPKSFPADSFADMSCPEGPIDSLGELRTDDRGRLLVVAAYGRACGWVASGSCDPGKPAEPYPLCDDVDNDGWFDDTADGPVSAELVFDDGATAPVAGAWVVATDPAFAPQTINVVSLWDDIFDTWVRKLDLLPDLFNVTYNRSYRPSFPSQVWPIFRAAAVQHFNTYLPDGAIAAHNAVGAIEAGDRADATILSGLAYIRNPNNPPERNVGVPLMPLSLGDSADPFLSPTLTQYFFLEQWHAGKATPAALQLGPGEQLDFASLFNCLGGRFSPGIDMTFVVRQEDIWEREWRGAGGPFRLRPRKLDYAKATSDQPFLTEGYVPVHDNDDGLEPGDTSKFMAIPWHTDYNSCATHPTEPNPANSTTLFWSWPAQRPVSVYVASDVKDDEKLPPQQYSIRGTGTDSPNPADIGRYQDRHDILTHWHEIGTVIQGTAITSEDGGPLPKHWFLEVKSQLTGESRAAEPWPLNATPGTQ